VKQSHTLTVIANAVKQSHQKNNNMQRGGATYIMTNNYNRVLYVGVTSDLVKRVSEHKTHAIPGFTDKYNCTKLVWYQPFDRIEDAIAEEKRLKAGNRERKLKLITTSNSDWKDLWEEIKDWNR
jgi:putative endonuclease